MSGDRVTQSLERHGRFARGEYLEGGGRIQSWVLGGEKGAVEARGVRPTEMYCLVHSPVRRQLYGLHSQLALVDVDVLGEPRCQVLDENCSVFLFTGLDGNPRHDLFPAGDVWDVLQSLYDCYLGQDDD